MGRIKIINKIKDLKNKKYGEIFIDGNFKTQKFRLILLTIGSLDDINLIRLLANWRKRHESWFQAIFKVTIRGTAVWLKEKVIETPDRLLFMIKVNNQYLGHIGLFRFNFAKASCEIDNIVRGKALYPGIMTEAIKTMMIWGRENLGLAGYTLQAASDNQKALNLYQRLGFIEEKRLPLVKTKKGNRQEWIEAPENYQRKIKRYNVFMKLKD